MDDIENLPTINLNKKSNESSVSSINSRNSFEIPKSINIRKQESVEISVSELELIANKNKMKNETSIEHKSRSISKSISKSISRPKSLPGYSKRVHQENKEQHIRLKKLEMLHKLSQMCMTYKRDCIVSMENTLDDIEIEFNRFSNEIQSIKGTDVCKTMLMLSVQGLEMANNKFDPIGVDLHGWSESLAYSVQNKDYDEVLLELYEKYKGSTEIMPELKLMLMLSGSAAMFAWTKRMSKSDPMEAFSRMFEKSVPEQVSVTESETSAKMEEPDDSIDLNEVNEKMNAQKKKKKGGRPPGSKNKNKKEVVLG